MVYFCAFARSKIFPKNARKYGVGRGQFDAGVNGLKYSPNVVWCGTAKYQFLTLHLREYEGILRTCLLSEGKHDYFFVHKQGTYCKTFFLCSITHNLPVIFQEQLGFSLCHQWNEARLHGTLPFFSRKFWCMVSWSLSTCLQAQFENANKHSRLMYWLWMLITSI